MFSIIALLLLASFYMMQAITDPDFTYIQAVNAFRHWVIVIGIVQIVRYLLRMFVVSSMRR